MRAAGVLAGVLTVVLDALKGASVVWLARVIDPGNLWLAVLSPVMAIVGHNYSIFLVQLTPDRRLRFRGGAGGAPCVGGAFGLWPPSLLIILPIVGIIWYGVGYASVTTMSAAFLALVIFAYRAYLGLNPWAYVIYALLAEILLVWALLPNIRRLINGTERLIGWRAKLKKN
jgi:glycerol-3-phosphate acyltransferase PlsY